MVTFTRKKKKKQFERVNAILCYHHRCCITTEQSGTHARGTFVAPCACSLLHVMSLGVGPQHIIYHLRALLRCIAYCMSNGISTKRQRRRRYRQTKRVEKRSKKRRIICLSHMLAVYNSTMLLNGCHRRPCCIHHRFVHARER